MIRALHRRVQDERGFTLVELLVVTIILSALAAIAVPSFLTQREKAFDAGAKSGARVAAAAIETFATQGDGTYDGATPALLEAQEPTLVDSGVTIVTAAGPAYELNVSSTSGNVFTVERRPSGEWRLECTTAGVAGCPADGRWD